LGDELASFDALVLFGNNFGLFATPARAHPPQTAGGP
jgi:hypothetical protein